MVGERVMHDGKSGVLKLHAPSAGTARAQRRRAAARRLAMVGACLVGRAGLSVLGLGAGLFGAAPG